MSENEILYLHHSLYEYLRAIHEADSTFLFRTRRQTDARFKKGYWFLGDSETIQLSFWETVGKKKKTNVLQVVYHFETQKWVCELAGREEGNRAVFAAQMANDLGGFVKKKEVWTKELGTATDFLSPLHAFIKTEKPRMDAYLKANLSNKILDFIALDWFQQDRTRIDNLKETFASDEAAEQIQYLKADFILCNSLNSNALPFALSRLHVSNFQGIQHLTIENLPLNAQWIFLTGENASGKTTVLKAIALALAGDEYADETYLTHSKIYVNGYNWSQPFLYEVKPQQVANHQFQVATYGVSRFRYEKEGDKNKKKTFSLFSDDAQLVNIERVLIDAERAKGEAKEKKGGTTFDQLKKSFLEVIPQLADIQIEYVETEPITNRYQVRYYEKDENGDLYDKPVKLNELAAGYRGILTMIGDMIVRLSENKNNLLDNLQGIVLIDEIDAHLHPKYQYDLPYLLSKVFPKIQFIVSTHSPIPILGVKSDTAVVLRVYHLKDVGVTVNRLDKDIDIHRLNPMALLTSPIFGFQQLFARDATPQEIIPTDNYEDVAFIKKMKLQLKTLRSQGLVQ